MFKKEAERRKLNLFVLGVIHLQQQQLEKWLYNFFVVSYRNNEDQNEDSARCSGGGLVQVSHKLSVWPWENHLYNMSINLVTCVEAGW